MQVWGCMQLCHEYIQIVRVHAGVGGAFKCAGVHIDCEGVHASVWGVHAGVWGVYANMWGACRCMGWMQVCGVHAGVMVHAGVQRCI